MSKNASQDYSLPPLLQGGDHWWSSTAINGAQSITAEASHQTDTLMLAQVSDWLGGIIGLAVLALFFWFGSTLRLTVRCPKCNQEKALIKTGATKGGGRVKRRVEWKCKYCDYREWQDKYSDFGWG